MTQTPLYFFSQLQEIVPLFPNQLDSDIDEHLLTNLKNKVSGKVIKETFIVRVNRIISYDHGMIDPSNFMGTTVYNIVYEALVCEPKPGTEIVCVLENVFNGFIIGSNGQIVITIETNNIDNVATFRNEKLFYPQSDKEVPIGTHMRASVINVRSGQYEKQIITICKLLRISNKDDIEQYKNEQNLIKPVTDNDAIQEFI